MFVLFSDTYIQRAKKTYTDNRGRRNLSTLNTELHDVQRIMVQNIDDVLQRGAVLSGKESVLKVHLMELSCLLVGETSRLRVVLGSGMALIHLIADCK